MAPDRTSFAAPAQTSGTSAGTALKKGAIALLRRIDLLLGLPFEKLHRLALPERLSRFGREVPDPNLT